MKLGRNHIVYCLLILLVILIVILYNKENAETVANPFIQQPTQPTANPFVEPQISQINQESSIVNNNMPYICASSNVTVERGDIVVSGKQNTQP
jgi:hypothetical protein